MPFVAGDDDGSCVEYTVQIPGDDFSVLAFSGALAQLAKVQNWEQTGTWTVEAIADVFRVALEAATWGECGEPGEGDLSFAVVCEEQPQGTGGGSFTSGDWRIRILNTVYDPDGILTLIGNQIILPAGTYIVFASAPAFKVNYHQIRVRNVTDGSTIALGTDAASNAGDDTATRSWAIKPFTLTAAKVIELQHRCSTSYGSYGFGRYCNFDTEVYSVVGLWKVAD